jgi:inner membrane protein
MSITSNLQQSVGLRMIIIFFLTLILFIPSTMILDLISEREYRKIQVIDEISQKWGGVQILAGPVLTIPYRELQSVDDEGKRNYHNRYVHILPEEFILDGGIDPQIRARGIYTAILYEHQSTMEGYFDFSELERLGVKRSDMMLDQAFISLGLNDLRGIREGIVLQWGDQELDAQPGVRINAPMQTGITFLPKNLSLAARIKFSTSIKINGSGSFSIIPVGKQSNIAIQSSWPDPSFSGSFLPVERSVSASGFAAQWQVLHFNRQFPQIWSDGQYTIFSDLVSVNLLDPVDAYRQTERSGKYAFLFIGLTFFALFLVEVLNRQAIHPIQYLLIGFGLVLFYLLLLAFSEHIAFLLAYTLASLAIITIITAYIFFVLRSVRLGVLLGGLVAILYTFLYILLQLQDYSVLVGSIGLLLLLVITMYVTRNVNWFTILDRPEKKNQAEGADA